MAPPDPAEMLLDGLDPSQRIAVTNPTHPLCILAGAGSGKTRVLTRRIAWRIVADGVLAQHVLALTFTRRAAGELTSRLAALGVRQRAAAGTFHGLAYAQLRRRWADADERPPALIDRKSRLLAPLLPAGSTDPATLAEAATEIEWAKARLVSPSSYAAAAVAAGRRPPLAPEAMADLFARYEREKESRHVVDFDDLLLRCADAIETDAQFAATQRWRFRHLFVDEFQDVNPAQYRLLRAWLGDSPDLCVVGDPNQAIYAWNGADPSYLSEFSRRFPTAACVRLGHNYRSSPQVLSVAAAVVGDSNALLSATEAEGPVPTVVAYPDDRQEASGIARALRRTRRPGEPWSSAAVLTRTHAQLVLIEEALAVAGIPYRVRGAARVIDTQGGRRALAQLRARPGRTPLAMVVADLADAARVPEGAEGPASTDRVEGSGTTPGIGADDLAALAELAQLARELLAAEPAATLREFLGWLAAIRRNDDSHTPADAVDLATLHAAKGLEWPVVFIAGAENGFIPIGHAESPEARAEERRLLYVGVTRARRELHLSWAQRRTFGERSVNRKASPYLERVEAAMAALREGGPDADWRRYLADGRARVGLAAETPVGRLGRDADPRLLAALKLWRTATARAACVPAHVVFHDTTLAALAEARPADREALLHLPGVGPLKVERYGDALLSVLASAS